MSVVSKSRERLLPPEMLPARGPENVLLSLVVLVQDPVTVEALALSCMVTELVVPFTGVEVPVQLPVRDGLDGAPGEEIEDGATPELEELPPQPVVDRRRIAARKTE